MAQAEPALSSVQTGAAHARRVELLAGTARSLLAGWKLQGKDF